VDVVTAFFRNYSLSLFEWATKIKCGGFLPKKGIFKVKDYFGALSIAEGSGFPWKSAWKTKFPTRAAFFV
jgi:hypothetical protein